jgi:uncharacterized protein (DUF433 family)
MRVNIKHTPHFFSELTVCLLKRIIQLFDLFYKSWHFCRSKTTKISLLKHFWYNLDAFIETNQGLKMNYQDIITIESGKRSGKPCIRGLRITVYDILEYLASGMSIEEILEEFDYLTKDDIQACLAYAADRERLQMANCA